MTLGLFCQNCNVYDGNEDTTPKNKTFFRRELSETKFNKQSSQNWWEKNPKNNFFTGNPPIIGQNVSGSNSIFGKILRQSVWIQVCNHNDMERATKQIIINKPMKINNKNTKWITIFFPFCHRHVILPNDLARQVPKSHLMTETEWRNLGVQQSPGWVHYMLHAPEPHVLLFRRPLPQQSQDSVASASSVRST